MNNPKTILAIDPDIERSGFALLDTQGHTFTMVQAFTISEAVKTLDALAAGDDKPLVVIEDSDTSTNWHVQKLLASGYPLRRKLNTAAAIGRSAGLCHAIIRVLREYAESVGLEVRMQKPLRKCWAGKDRKITHAECIAFMNGVPKRTNAEERDAMLIAWVVGNLPIRIRPTQ